MGTVGRRLKDLLRRSGENDPSIEPQQQMMFLMCGYCCILLHTVAHCCILLAVLALLCGQMLVPGAMLPLTACCSSRNPHGTLTEPSGICLAYLYCISLFHICIAYLSCISVLADWTTQGREGLIG